MPMDTDNARADERVTVVQADVEFYGDSLIAVRASDDDLYISLPQMCRCLTLNTQAQARRIRRTEALDPGLRELRVEAPDGKKYDTLCLRVDLVPSWLGGITASKIEDEALRRKVLAFQTDLTKVVWAVMGPMRGAVVLPQEADALAKEMQAVNHHLEAMDEALALLRQELSQRAQKTDRLEVLFNGVTAEVSQLRAQLGDLETRSAKAFQIAGQKIHRMELRLNPGTPITQEQAARIQEAVAYIAQAMEARGVKKAYGQVWLQFKTVFALTEYKALPQGRFTEALEWLDAKRRAVLADDAPSR
jgi:hypothetical protein